MQPRLIKIAIPKSTLALRLNVQQWLDQRGSPNLMPKKRGTADAMRVAISYVLRDWTNWKGEDGTVYKAIAAAPTEARGLCLDINIQIRKSDGVQYSETVCRIIADDETCYRMSGNTEGFRELYNALDADTLLRLGSDHLFDSDLRLLAESFLEGAVDRLWPGVWLCLTETPALEHIAYLSTLVCAGSINVTTLTLDASQANRAMLADELAREYVGQLEKLTKRLAYPKPNLESIEADYMILCGRIRQSEEVLGVPIACLSEQVQFEEALALTTL